MVAAVSSATASPSPASPGAALGAALSALAAASLRPFRKDPSSAPPADLPAAMPDSPEAASPADTTPATPPAASDPPPADSHLALKPISTKLQQLLHPQPTAGPNPVCPATLTVMGLYSEIVAAFAHEQALGFATNNTQPQVSFLRLDGTVRRLLSDYAQAASDWRAFAHFNDLHYVRNLIDTNDSFELMVICWKRGQASRVHNHGRSHCWLTVLDGSMTEVKYHDPEGLGVHSPRATEAGTAPDIPGVITAVSPCPDLEALGATELQRGDVSYISDRIALHAVRCSELLAEGAEGGVTLHLYAPPIRRVTLYEPELDRVVERIPGFFTIKGQRT